MITRKFWVLTPDDDGFLSIFFGRCITIMGGNQGILIAVALGAIMGNAVFAKSWILGRELSFAIAAVSFLLVLKYRDDDCDMEDDDNKKERKALKKAKKAEKKALKKARKKIKKAQKAILKAREKADKATRLHENKGSGQLPSSFVGTPFEDYDEAERQRRENLPMFMRPKGEYCTSTVSGSQCASWVCENNRCT